MFSNGAVGGIKRGCGLRKGGGVYAECSYSPVGRHAEYFLLCPPQVVDAEALGVTAIGVQLVQWDGIWHVLDWVGSQYYPHVADFVEETRRFGVSRRLPKDLDFSKLTPESRMILLHSEAWIDDVKEYVHQRIGGEAFGKVWKSCPKDKIHGPHEMCAGLWWEDISHVKPVDHERMGKRVMPSFEYLAARPPVEKVGHKLAMFATFPISRLVVIRAKDGSHEAAFEAISKSSLDHEIVEE